jgi:hypothetical protein
MTQILYQEFFESKLLSQIWGQLHFPAKTTLKEAIGDHRDGVAASYGVIGMREQPPGERGQLKGLEEVARDDFDTNTLGGAVDDELSGRARPGGEPLPVGRAVAEPGIHRVGEDGFEVVRTTAAGKVKAVGMEDDEFAGRRDGQSPQQDLIEEGEYGRCRCDTEGEGANRDGEEARLAA